MDDQVSATIIPFPVRSSGTDVPPPTQRLSESLKSLSVALTEQRDALQRWRDALAELSEKMKTMNSATGR